MKCGYFSVVEKFIVWHEKVTFLLKCLVQIETAQKERALALEMRDRLERVRPDRDKFLSKLKAERASVYKVTNIYCDLK